MIKSRGVIQLSAMLAVALFTGCGQNNDLRPTSYQTFPKNPNYAIIKPTPTKCFSEDNLACMIKELQGRPYVWAEEGPYCFDCSGYLYYMFGKMGVDIPRTAREQIKYGEPVAFEDLKFGDLVFFDTTRGKKGKITHVGIYLKDGWFSQASSSHKQIIYTNFNTDKYYRSRFVTARRYYEKDGDRYAMMIAPTCQTDFAQILASNNIKKQEFKPTAYVAFNANVVSDIKFTESKTPKKYAATIKENTNSNPVEDDATLAAKAATESTNLANNTNDYQIKEDIIASKDIEKINNTPIQETDLSAIKSEDITISPEKIAEVEKSNISGGYYVQVGKFQNMPDQSFLNKIKAQGYAYRIMPMSENGKIASKILIGPFKNDTEAHGKLDDVKENIVKEAFVTKLDS